MTTAVTMSHATRSLDIPKPRDHSVDASRTLVMYEQRAAALLTPPDSVSPNFSPFVVALAAGFSPAPSSLDHRASSADHDSPDLMNEDEPSDGTPQSSAVPLSRGALSGLNAAAAITPALLAKHYLPSIMLGNGPKPIRFVMGELTQTVPGFSRIPPAKARRLVVAALESRAGGGVDGNVTFYKTGWGRWDAHLKTSARDSAVGSFHDNRLSPPRSERSGYALSHADSGAHLHGPTLPANYRDHSGESWTASSLREEDEMYIDMDVPENDADKMSLDGLSDDESDDLDELNDDTDDDVDWAAAGPAALRKASMSIPGTPRRDYNALSSSYCSRRPSKQASQRHGSYSARPSYSTSLPFSPNQTHTFHPSLTTPDEKAAIAALLSLGSM